MLNLTRRATSAAVLIIAVVAAAIPHATLAQGQTTAPSAPATQVQSTAPAPSGPGPGTASTPSVGAAKAAIERAATPEVENPYGLEALWRGSDWVAKGTLVILVIMSMGTWYVIITKLYEQAKLRREG